jgi:hypothetical protein
MRAIVILPLVMFALIAGFFAWALLGKHDSSILPSALIDQPAPQMKLEPLLPTLPGLDVAALKGEVVLVNIFAGINRCDWVAKGVVQACTTVDVKVPLVVRLAGTNVEEGRKILAESGLKLITAETLAEAAEKAVEACQGRLAA